MARKVLETENSADETIVEGEFDVEMAMQESTDTKLGLITLKKVYRGDLVAEGADRMLTGMTEVSSSAAYVAIEKITGTLDGKQGSFVVYHCGVMHGGDQKLDIAIVPDSGTGELKGIRGTMKIDIRDGKHIYKLIGRVDGAAKGTSGAEHV